MHEALIDRIYEAAGTPELWPDVLQCLADTAKSDGGVLTVLPPVGRPRWIVSPTLQNLKTIQTYSTFLNPSRFRPSLPQGWISMSMRPLSTNLLNHRPTLAMSSKIRFLTPTVVKLDHRP